MVVPAKYDAAMEQFKDAMVYVRTVKDSLGPRSVKLLCLLTAYRKKKRINLETVGLMAKKLFIEHPDLLLALQTFLATPTTTSMIEYLMVRMVAAGEDDAAILRRFKDALAYVRRVEAALGPGFVDFNEFLNGYRMKRITLEMITLRVGELFRGHCDLWLAFRTFLPVNFTIEQRPDKKRQILEMVIAHISKCRNHDCIISYCREFKSLLRHAIECPIKLVGGCQLCKRLWILLQLHAVACKVLECKFPHCKDLKKHKLMKLQSDTRS